MSAFRVDDRVRVADSGSAPWKILAIVDGLAQLTRLGADPRSDMDGIPLSRLIPIAVP